MLLITGYRKTRCRRRGRLTFTSFGKWPTSSPRFLTKIRGLLTKGHLLSCSFCSMSGTLSMSRLTNVLTKLTRKFLNGTPWGLKLPVFIRRTPSFQTFDGLC